MDKIFAVLRTAPAICWSCGCETKILSSVTFSQGCLSVDCFAADFTDWPDLVDKLVASLPLSHGVGAIKPRRSATAGRTYMSNGCRHCDAIFGHHFELHTRYDEKVVGEIQFTASERWRAFLAAQPE
jgi:competence protein CoiA